MRLGFSTVLTITQPLWPIHPKPFNDELLSSWLVRIAHGHGLKVQSFCNLAYGNEYQIWNRDIDRLAPKWLIEDICTHTGTTLDAGMATTLRGYEGLLFPTFHATGLIRWVLPLQLYHRKHLGNGLQFCPGCLAMDKEPYFRRRWRVAANVVCPKHNCQLYDSCPCCKAPIVFHRLELGRPEMIEAGPMCCCFACGYDLREAELKPLQSYNREAAELLFSMSLAIEGKKLKRVERLPEGIFGVMHQLCRLFVSRYPTVRLRQYVIEELGIADIPLSTPGVSLVSRPVHERAHLMQLAAWLVAQPKRRLTYAWRSRSVKYNQFLKDFADPPAWYEEIVGDFSDWRTGLACR